MAQTPVTGPQTQIYVGNLADTTLVNVTDGQVLTYQGSTDTWINANAGGGASAPPQIIIMQSVQEGTADQSAFSQWDAPDTFPNFTGSTYATFNTTQQQFTFPATGLYQVDVQGRLQWDQYANMTSLGEYDYGTWIDGAVSLAYPGMSTTDYTRHIGPPTPAGNPSAYPRINDWFDRILIGIVNPNTPVTITMVANAPSLSSAQYIPHMNIMITKLGELILV